ncbi:gluconokinase [Sabulilitoribacter multivorans]|uniref:Gluconokinase n=1 Tax=Flaviramulus multivorans TaxID=1304750 RepID=A0ABS9IHY8_9FLAO|nr:gluconokinase [Flaviramulus multivorans]MCF7560339.1 gluconokinase [Flaviramulus multivorans]
MIIIMGVSGCGKTTIGELLSKKSNLPFYDADDFHPSSNIEKMKNNIALTDGDRKPWLELLSENIEQWELNGGAILACSALKESYRQILSSKIKNINWVYLSGTFDEINARLEKRNNHYMKSTLLKSQFDTLEVPSYGIHISITNSKENIVSIITSKLNLNE